MRRSLAEESHAKYIPWLLNHQLTGITHAELKHRERLVMFVLPRMLSMMVRVGYVQSEGYPQRESLWFQHPAPPGPTDPDTIPPCMLTGSHA